MELTTGPSKTHCGLELVVRCEPSSCHTFSRCLSLCIITLKEHSLMALCVADRSLIELIFLYLYFCSYPIFLQYKLVVSNSDILYFRIFISPHLSVEQNSVVFLVLLPSHVGLLLVVKSLVQTLVYTARLTHSSLQIPVTCTVQVSQCPVIETIAINNHGQEGLQQKGRGGGTRVLNRMAFKLPF